MKAADGNAAISASCHSAEREKHRQSFDRVSEQSNEVLRTAAVLGKTFCFDELKAAAGKTSDDDALLDALDEAVGAQLIVAAGEDAFTFTHDKIREVLYEELNPIRRRRLHRLAAEGLESHRQCAVEKLAHHYIQAGDYERGLVYAKRAAHEAERCLLDEAIAAYTRALDCAEALAWLMNSSSSKSIGKVCMLHGKQCR